MSQQFQQYYVPEPRRPTSVTVLAIIGIVLGALGVCGTLSSIAQLVGGASGNPFVREMQRDAGWRTWNLFSTTLGVLLLAALLAGSIGMLSLRPWARKLMIYYAVATLVLAAVSLVVNILLMMPLLDRLATSSNQTERTMAAIMRVTFWIAPVFAMIYPIFILVFLRKSHVIAAFTESNTPMASYYVPPPPPPPT